MQANDERLGLPSASGFERLMLCPGSWQMEKGMPETPSAISESGQRIHDHVAGFRNLTLTHEEIGIADKCNIQRDELLGWKSFRDSLNTESKVIVETRLWLTDDDGKIMSGKADLIVIRNREAFVVDYKTGWCEVISAQRNPQLMALAVIVDQYTEGMLEKITVAIIQPEVSSTPSVAVYDRHGISLAKNIVIETAKASNNPNLPRIPGEKQCKYCKGKLKCHEAIKQLEVVAGSPLQLIPEMDAPSLARLLDACEFADVIGDAVRKEAKKRLGAGVEVPGWTLKPGVWMETVNDVPLLFQRLQANSVTAQEFAAICTASKKSVVGLLREKTGLKGAELEAMLACALEGCTESKQAAPSLVREK